MTIDEAFNLGLECHRTGQLARAESIYRQILQQHPTHPDVPINLGSVLHDLGRREEAAAVYRQALATNPASAQLWCNLGNTLCDLDQIEPAIVACRQALAINPQSFGAYNNLGNALKRQGRLDDSEHAYRQALALRPDFAFAHNNLGNVLLARGDLSGAISSFRRALEFSPQYAEAMNNLGNALGSQGAWDQALAHCRRSVAMQPNYPPLHWNLALLLLRRGEFAEGWAEYEWRWRVPHLIASPLKYSTTQLWDGCALNGRRILLHAEQGLGDAIQFARYVPLVVGRGGIVALYTPAEILPLWSNMDGVVEAAAWMQPLPAFDFHAPLLSLPGIFKTTLTDIPAPIPYIRAQEQRAVPWRKRLSAEPRRKVGLVWAGRPAHGADRERSIKLSDLAPLAQAKSVRFISLQKGSAAEQTRSAPFEITDWTGELIDFADTAALIDHLDLVITVDTATAHLAGAMGKPVWTLLPFSPDWRWMLDRPDSPWYPTMRLFRQPRLGDWQTPIRQIAEALQLA